MAKALLDNFGDDEETERLARMTTATMYMGTCTHTYTVKYSRSMLTTASDVCQAAQRRCVSPSQAPA